MDLRDSEHQHLADKKPSGQSGKDVGKKENAFSLYNKKHPSTNITYICTQ